MNYYDEIKYELINNDINRKVKSYLINKNDLDTYYNVGKMLSDAGKHYGEGIIKKYSIKLINEVDKKYNITTLKRIRQFYRTIEKGATLWHQLSWSHYKLLISLESIDEINYYSRVSVEKLYSVRKLEEKIKSNEYKRLSKEIKNKSIINDKQNIKNSVPNPIIIKNNSNYEVITEKILQRIIMEDISSFLEELGFGFTFVKNEFKIKMNNNFNYIDLLLFNIEYNCYIVIELKVTEIKKEHLGQIQVYMNYIDENLKKKEHNKTIGIIVCKEDNKYVIKYCSDSRIIAREYKLLDMKA